MTTTRKLAITVWSAAILTLVIWWPLSYRYSTGFTVSTAEPPGLHGLRKHSSKGIAAVSGVGKILLYVSWKSAFTRSGFIFEPVLPHEFPHPWFGFQNEGGRMWISFPVGLVFAFVSAGAFFHLRPKGS